MKTYNQPTEIITRQSGFSFVQLVLWMSLGSMGAVAAVDVFSNYTKTYNQISHRQNQHIEAQHAAEIIEDTILLLDVATITAATATSLSFMSSKGPITLSWDPTQANAPLQLNQEILVEQVSSFSLEYKNSNAQVVADPVLQKSSIAEVGFSLETPSQGNSGKLSLTSRIVPRTQMYAGFK
jgi:hypothetical protein